MDLLQIQSPSPKPKHNSGLTRQVLASFIMCASTFHIGMTVGWLSPMSLKLKKESSPVETMNKDELGLLGALPSYASLVIAFFVSYIAKTFGRKIGFYVTGVAGILAGLIFTFAPSKAWLYAGRTLAAFSFCATNVPLMYIAETVHESVRGTMLTASTLLFNCGILLSYYLGDALSYKAFNATFFILGAAYTISAIWLPETPYYLIEKSKLDQAKKSLLFFRGGNNHIVESELDDIKSAESGGGVTFLEVLKKKSTRKALIISTLAFAFQTLSGVQAVLNYAGLIFEEAGSPLSPETSSIVTAAILVGATMLNVILIDRLGRKPLLYVSFIFGASTMASLTAFLYFYRVKEEMGSLSWIPIVSLCTFIVAYGMGLTAVPGTLMSEISPTAIRPVVGAVIIVVSLTLISIIIQSFPYLDDNLGLYSVFALPTVFNILGVFFTWFLVPETKGKSFSEIENILNH